MTPPHRLDTDTRTPPAVVPSGDDTTTPAGGLAGDDTTTPNSGRTEDDTTTPNSGWAADDTTTPADGPTKDGTTSVIGWVDGRPVPRERLDARLAALRNGPLKAALPTPGTSEDRQLARWLTQVILTEILCESTAADLGLTPGPQPTSASSPLPTSASPSAPAPALASPPAPAPAPASPPASPSAPGAALGDPGVRGGTEALTLDRVAAVELGSINAAAYNGSPWVRAVFEHVTATVTVPEEWRRPPAPEQPARHYVRHRLFDTLAEAQAATPSDLEPLGPITLDSLPTAIAEALQSHPYDTLVGPVRDTLGWHVATATPTPPQANDPAPQATSPASETTSPAPQTNSPASETTGPAARTTGPTAFTQAATTTPPTPMSPSAPPTQTVLTSSPTRTVPATPPIQAAHTAAQPLAAVASSPSPAAEATAQPYVPEGTVQTLTRHTSRPTGPDADLLAAARRKAFARWLDDMRARKVTLVPGLEHPGDPRQPDNHHKH